MRSAANLESVATCRTASSPWASSWLTGSYSNAPMPRRPVQQRRSTGFKLSGGRPCLTSQALIKASPNRSGSESANNPGNPLKLLGDISGNEKTSGPSGILIGETWIPLRMKSGSYSKNACPRPGSNETAAISVPHNLTRARVGFIGCHPKTMRPQGRKAWSDEHDAAGTPVASIAPTGSRTAPESAHPSDQRDPTPGKPSRSRPTGSTPRRFQAAGRYAALTRPDQPIAAG